MKITKILGISMAAFMLLAAPFADANAQTRKKGSKARTSTAAKKKTAAAPKVGPLTAEDFTAEKGNHLVGYQDFGDTNGMLMWQDIALDGDGKATVDYFFTELDGTYSVSDNHLLIDTGGMNWNFTSPNGGQTLNGIVNNGKSEMKGVLYRVSMASQPVQEIVDAMLANKYIAYITVEKRGEAKLCLPVTATFAKKTSGDGYTWKITSNHKLMASMGIVKGSFRVSGDKVSFSDASGNNCASDFEVAAMPSFRLYVTIPGYRGVTAKLQLIRK